MENKDKAGWQKEFSKVFEEGWDFVAGSYTCAKDIFYELALPYALEGGRYAVKGAEYAYDELKEVFSEDGYFANPDKFMADLKTRMEQTGIDKFGYDSASNVGDCLGVTDDGCDLGFGLGKNLPPGMQDDINEFNRKQKIWDENKTAHDNSKEMIINRANDIGEYSENVVNDVEKLFTNPKESKIGSFFIGAGDSFEDLVTGDVSGDDLIENLLDPGSWRIPGL